MLEEISEGGKYKRRRSEWTDRKEREECGGSEEKNRVWKNVVHMTWLMKQLPSIRPYSVCTDMHLCMFTWVNLRQKCVCVCWT